MESSPDSATLPEASANETSCARSSAGPISGYAEDSDNRDTAHALTGWRRSSVNDVGTALGDSGGRGAGARNQQRLERGSYRSHQGGPGSHRHPRRIRASHEGTGRHDL